VGARAVRRMSANEIELCVVGAGAAGLWAAAEAARRGLAVLLLEKTARTGTKVLASGGTRCNLTTTLSADEAARLFRGPGERFLRAAFRNLPPEEVRRRFDAWGVPTVEAPLEKIFPESGRAKDVRDALEREARAAGVRIGLDSSVLGITREEDTWVVSVAGAPEVRCQKLMLCAGGKSFPLTGTTGEGYEWLRSLGLSVTETVPALTPLASSADWVHALSGIAWQDGEARLLDAGGKLLARRRRPLLFTHEGVSGPAAMDLSVHVAKAPDQPFTLALDLFPDLEREALRTRMIEAAGEKGSPRVSRSLPAAIPRRFVRTITHVAGLEEDPRASELTKPGRHALVETLKGLPIPIDGTLGFDKAEVTAGGLSLKVVNPRTMEVNGHPGLYVFGELLDLDGPIGGLNFQAAFACAQLAAEAVAQ